MKNVDKIGPDLNMFFIPKENTWKRDRGHEDTHALMIYGIKNDISMM